MIIYPAIDLRAGKVVRLREGDPARQSVFSEDPVATAQTWIDQGAQWLHVVNLDGAFAQANENLRIVESIAALGVKLQFGGGLRDWLALEQARASGVTRLVIGTLAVQQPELVERALAKWGADAITIALDAKDGKVVTHGWTRAAAQSPVEMGLALRRRGFRHALYTDVQRDGALSGGNIDATIELAEQTGLQVIASGGISSLQDIERLAGSRLVAGAVLGMALYQGQVALPDAIRAAEGS